MMQKNRKLIFQCSYPLTKGLYFLVTVKEVASSVPPRTLIDSSVLFFYTKIETKILNTDSDPQNTDRHPIIRVIAIQQITLILR